MAPEEDEGPCGEMVKQAESADNRGDRDQVRALHEQALAKGLTPTWAASSLARIGEVTSLITVSSRRAWAPWCGACLPQWRRAAR